MSLDPIPDGLWCVNGHFDTPFFRGSTRMTVIRGAESLILYSPVALSPEDRQALAAIGPVAAIISPNLYHHMFLRAAVEAFPSARVFVPEGLEAKIGPIPRAETMNRAGPQELTGGIENFFFDRQALR